MTFQKVANVASPLTVRFWCSPGFSHAVARAMGYYSGMVVDPGDDCTFWYTNQQLTRKSAINWHTRMRRSSSTVVSSNVYALRCRRGALVFTAWKGQQPQANLSSYNPVTVLLAPSSA